MRGWGIPILGLVLISLSPAGGRAQQQNTCTDAEETQAEKAVDSLKTWDQVYRAYKKFAQCDDGAVAEGFSDTVGKLLANEWGRFPRLVRHVKADKGFESFVVKHVDESLSRETLEKISKNARSDCPANAKRLCSAIGGAASGK